MKKLFAIVAMAAVCMFGMTTSVVAQEEESEALVTEEVVEEATDEEDAAVAVMEEAEEAEEVEAAPAEGATEEESVGIHKVIKEKFIEGGAGFMALVAIALVLGLALCIERIVYLSLAAGDRRKFCDKIAELVAANKIQEAIDFCNGSRSTIAKVCKKALVALNSEDQNDIATIERSINMEAEVQGTYLEENCSWITLFIAMAPSLGFLGTVIGMVQAFDDIQAAGDISPTVVAGGMKVALITTIFGIVVALILQLFYNYILSRVEAITCAMEESAQEMLVICVKSPKCKK